MTTPAEAAAELLRRRKAREHLLDFTVYTHPKWEVEAHHGKICHHLERLERREVCPSCGNVIDKLADFAPPRSAKTELSLRRFSAWVMGRHPGWHVISAMANSSLASDTGGEVRDIVSSPEFARIFPLVKLKEDARAANRWVVECGRDRGVYFCGGVDASFPGRGANVLDVDDPHKSAQEADSPRMRHLVAKAYFGDLIHRLEDPSIQLLTNTRRHEDDLAGRILSDDSTWDSTGDPQFFCDTRTGWHVLRLRAIEDEHTPYEVALKTRGCPKDADPLDHMRGIRDLYTRKGQMRHWTSEFQQSPAAEKGTYTQREWFDERYETLPEDLNIYMASDFAVTKAEEGTDPDYTEHGVFGLCPDDRLYVLDWWSGQETADVWITSLLELVRKHKPQAWFGEAGVIRRAVEPFLEREATSTQTYFRSEWIASTTNKTVRGRAFQAWASSRRIIFPRTPWAQRVIDQCVKFPGGSHDDAFDVLSLMCLAIDNTHPAISRDRTQAEPPDPYEDATTGVADGWRTA